MNCLDKSDKLRYCSSFTRLLTEMTNMTSIFDYFCVWHFIVCFVNIFFCSTECDPLYLLWKRMVSRFNFSLFLNNSRISKLSITFYRYIFTVLNDFTFLWQVYFLKISLHGNILMNWYYLSRVCLKIFLFYNKSGMNEQTFLSCQQPKLDVYVYVFFLLYYLNPK